MIDRDEIVRSLNGAWSLFLDRPDAMRSFDTSYQGFWRSFQAIILVVPSYALTVLADRRNILTDSIADDSFNESAFMVARWLALGLDWITLPLLLAALADFLGIGRTYVAYIVARNWSSVLLLLPFAAIAFFDLAGLISSDILFLPYLFAVAVALRFSYLIARRTLGVPVDVAIGYVLLDFFLSLGLAQVIGALFGVGAAI